MGTALLHTYRCWKFSSAWGEITKVLGSIKIQPFHQGLGGLELLSTPVFVKQPCTEPSAIPEEGNACSPTHGQPPTSGKTTSRRSNCIPKNYLRKCEPFKPCCLGPNLGFLLWLEKGCDQQDQGAKLCSGEAAHSRCSKKPPTAFSAPKKPSALQVTSGTESRSR